MASVDPADGISIEMPSIALVGEVRGMLEQCKSEIIGSDVTSITDTSSLTTYHQYFLRIGEMLDDNPDISYFSITIIPTDGTGKSAQFCDATSARRVEKTLVQKHTQVQYVSSLSLRSTNHKDNFSSLDNWYSVKSSPNMDPQTTSTITITFPGDYPEFSTDYRGMECTQLHGKPPKSISRVAIWGARSEDRTTWSSLMTFSDNTAAVAYSKKLEDLLASTDSESRMEVASHWMIGFQYVEDTPTLPTIVGAHACLMLMNHLEYHQQLIQSFQDARDLPPKWQLNETPNWTESLTVMCRALTNDIGKVYKDASSTRGVIIEQHNLSQSRNLGFLTILATIFVPMTAMAGFFGMNTTEINGSNWSIKHFIAVAVPLTVVSVLLPLVALQLLKAVAWAWCRGNRRGLLVFNIVRILSLVAFLLMSISKHTGILRDDMNAMAVEGLVLYFGLSFGLLEILSHAYAECGIYSVRD
ncbi:magnesium and cobalt transporter [Seiridium cupressi]